MFLSLFVLFAELSAFAAARTQPPLKPDGVYPSNALSNNSQEIIFEDEEPLEMTETHSHVIFWKSFTPLVKRIEVTLEDNFTAVISNHGEVIHSLSNITHSNGDVTHPVAVEGFINVTAKFIGYNKVFVSLKDGRDEILAKASLKLEILLLAKTLVKVYQICLTIILIVVYTNMGANLDLELVKMITKKPVGPLIGLVCQYLCMPLIAFSLGLLLFPYDPLFRLGLFASGCSPGGGLSNMWTHLLGGSLDLSIMMTFVSTLAALGTVPLWLLTLGKVILKDVDFVIPFKNVVIGICILIFPCFLGILIQLKLPRVTKWMKIILTPLSLFNVLFIFTFGVYVNFYLFSYITWEAVGAGFGQSIFGALAGFLVALLCRRNTKEIIAISIETAVQNNGIAFILLKMSLEKPEGDLAVLIPGCVALFIPMLLIFALVVKTFHEKIIQPKFLNQGNKEIGGSSKEGKESNKDMSGSNDEKYVKRETENGRQDIEDAKQNGIQNPTLNLEESEF